MKQAVAGVSSLLLLLRPIGERRSRSLWPRNGGVGFDAYREEEKRVRRKEKEKEDQSEV